MLVKGYKGMRSDMTCRGMQYEVGKTYHAIGAVELCRNGFHFCRRLSDAFKFYMRLSGNRFFEVEANEIDTDGIKSVASEIHIIREVSEIELNRASEGSGLGDGYGIVDGCGSGDGSSRGYGYGYGDGSGRGDGDGHFNGNGSGCGSANGDDKGNGFGLGRFIDFGYGVENVLIFE